ncbi:MAG: hypothetical protein PHT38_02375 [Halothiobacillus sp.]|nr:hypothetical protein [Halothiobacillus sp.]
MSNMTKNAFHESVKNFARTCEEYVQSVMVTIHDQEDVQDMTANIVMRRGEEEWNIPIGISGDGEVSIAAHPDTEGYLSLTEANLYSYLWVQACKQVTQAKEQYAWLIEQKNSAYNRESGLKAIFETIEKNGSQKYPIEQWREEVALGVTTLGYAHWAYEQMKFKPKTSGIAA